jgi:signal transduction histidine kinase
LEVWPVWDWIQQNSSGISILLSLAGFLILIIQAVRTRRAAEAASSAAEASRQTLLHATTVADLAGARGLIETIQYALRWSRWETALIHAQELRNNMTRIRGRSELSSEETQTQIQEMVTQLVKLHESLERKLVDANSALDTARVCTRLATHATTITAWAEKARTATEGGQNGR